MRIFIPALVAGSLALSACGGDSAASETESTSEATTERNKRLAREFYENLWFSNNTDTYADYVADEYVVHDIGGRKGVTEKAIVQKQIADRFHGFGPMTGEIDYQIAEGDKVATRWFISSEPNEVAAAAGLTKIDKVPIINVFRFNEDGKIVEIWNHRHDVDLPRPPDEAGPPPSE